MWFVPEVFTMLYLHASSMPKPKELSDVCAFVAPCITPLPHPTPPPHQTSQSNQRQSIFIKCVNDINLIGVSIVD